MSAPDLCPDCGAPLPSDAPKGHCPRCLMQAALGGGPPAAPPAGPPAPTGAPADSPDGSLEQEGDRIGRYTLLQKIGEGGLGDVWMAEQEEPVRRRVALKVIKAGMDTKQVIARFEAERQALALMDHPNIARVFDAGATDRGRPFFVMELVRGIRITDYCDQNQLSTAERLALFIPVCNAIQHAHQKGVIHRDIKPSNILVTLHDGEPVPKVIDFGIAKATGEQLTDKTLFTRFEQFLGTPAYMSPEQAGLSGLDIDTRSDIYALGVLLYELLTGKTPFETRRLLEAGLEEIRRIIREEEPPRPSTRLTGLGPEELGTLARRRKAEAPKLIHLLRGDLDWIILKCLEKDRTRRYETANGLALDIQRHLNIEPVTAGPPAAAYRLGKLVRKHRTAMAVTAGFVLLLTAASAVSIRLAVWAIRESEDAVKARRDADKKRGDAERNLYIANMNLAQWEWGQTKIRRLRELLDETAGYPQRGFEWYYWQRQAHLELRTFRVQHWSVGGVAFSPDGRRIVTASTATAKVWEVASGKELLTLEVDGGLFPSVVFSPDGQRIATSSADNTVKVWDAASGKELLTLKGHGGLVTSVAFSPDGQRIVTGSWDRTSKVWEAGGGKELLTLKGHGHEVGAVAFSPDGRLIVTGSSDGTAKVWEAVTKEQVARWQDEEQAALALPSR